MRTLGSSLPWLTVTLAVSLASGSAWGQARPRPRPPTTPQPAPAQPDAADPQALPGDKGPLPSTMDSIAQAADTPYKPKPMGYRVKFNLQDADLAELVNHISGLTGKRFIYGPKVRSIKATVISPTPVTLAEAYEAFLSILEANGMTVVPHGPFLKIVDTAQIVNQPTPVYARGAVIPDEERYLTRLYRVRNVSAEEVANLLNKYKSKEADVSAYAPGQLVIMTDTGANIRRMIRIIEEVDVGGAGARMWIEPVHYGSAQELATKVNDLFDLGKEGGANGGLAKVVASEDTNSLIIVGTEDSYLKLLELLKRLDTKPASEGRIHVLPLQNAVAEELANTLTQMLTGSQQGQQQRQGGNQGAPGVSVSPIFEGDVRVTADKATNSLVITSSGRDYAQLRLVVEDLDAPRRQVFIEAVIMDVSVDNGTNLGLSYHAGAAPDLGGSDRSLVYGGLNPLNSILLPTPDQLQGFALGVRGPGIEGTTNLFNTGLTVPAFGVVINALAQSSAANVLSTPHILATDNVPAEISVGENIPLQTNVGGSNLAGLAGRAGGNQAAGALGALGGLGGLGFGGFASPRQDVGTKIKVTPHINKKNQVRLEIEQEISERGAATGQLGAVSITKRTANTTLIVENQQTVVIGGLMRDGMTRSRRKIPVLGDLPLLGFLFRSSEVSKRKTNLLLILTPYVIHEQADLRRVFERKMQERQEFLDRYFVFADKDWKPPRDYTRTNGLVEDVRQALREIEERERLEEESMPADALEHEPSDPIELPVEAVPTGGGAPTRTNTPRPAAPAPRPAPQRPQRRTAPAPPQPRSMVPPIRVAPMARYVNAQESP